MLWATDIDSTDPDDRGIARDSMCTPRALRKMGDGRGCKTGVGWLYGQTSTYDLTDKQLGAGRLFSGNLQAGVLKSILHIALDQEEVAQRTRATSEKRGGEPRGQRIDARAS